MEDNALVRAGQPPLSLDPATFQARVKTAEAAVAAADASVHSVHRKQAQEEVGRSDLEGAQAELVIAQPAAQFVRTESSRYAHLAQTQAGSEQDAPRRATDLVQTQAAQNAASAAVASPRRALAVISAQRVEAEATLNQSDALLDESRLEECYTTVYAPIEGYVSNRSARTGSYLVAGTPLMSLVPARGLWADANF